MTESTTPRATKRLKMQGQQESEESQASLTVPESPALQDNVQDQILIVPEIMEKVLELLELRSLKIVRLVCKSWLREAQIHLEQRGAVRLYTGFVSTAVEDFVDILQEKIPALPQPFGSIAVDLSGVKPESHVGINQNLVSLCPAHQITNFTPAGVPLSLAIPLIQKWSSTLEYLELSSNTCKAGHLPSWDPKTTFPKLHHLNILTFKGRQNSNTRNSSFPSVVAWVASGSTNLKTYECVGKDKDHYGSVIDELASEILLKIDIKGVKTLCLVGCRLNTEAFNHFLSIQFTSLEYLSLDVCTQDGILYRSSSAIVKTIEKSASSLRMLNLSRPGHFLIGYEILKEFPVCTQVQELTLYLEPFQKSFFSAHMPSLQVLNMMDRGALRFSKEFWSRFKSPSPFSDLKTLRLKSPQVFCDVELGRELRPMEFEFFENFPTLERLCIHFSLLKSRCTLIASGNPRYSKLLDTVKHLELHGNDINNEVKALNDPEGLGYYFVAALTGLETITLWNFTEAITTIPVKELPSLKSIRFPWDDCSKSEQLIKFIQGVKKAKIFNCCSILRLHGSECVTRLEKFFESASNAECGCEDEENWLPAHFDQWIDKQEEGEEEGESEGDSEDFEEESEDGEFY